jgi:hypothetical protein
MKSWTPQPEETQTPQPNKNSGHLSQCNHEPKHNEIATDCLQHQPIETKLAQETEIVGLGVGCY